MIPLPAPTGVIFAGSGMMGRVSTWTDLWDYHVKIWNKALADEEEDISVDEPLTKVTISLYETEKRRAKASKPNKGKIEAADKDTISSVALAVSPLSFPGFPTVAPVYQNPWQQMPQWPIFWPSLPIQQTAYSMPSNQQ